MIKFVKRILTIMHLKDFVVIYSVSKKKPERRQWGFGKVSMKKGNANNLFY